MKEAEKATFLDGPHRIARNGQVVIRGMCSRRLA